MKRIIIVTYAFYPGNSPRALRATELAKELVREGHRVTVYIPGPLTQAHSDFMKKVNITIQSMGLLRYKPVRSSSFIGRIFRRGLELLFEYPDVELAFRIPKALKYADRCDLLISIAVPHPNHWGVARALNKYPRLCRVWVADCGDPYMGCRTDTFNKWFHFKYVEKWWCRRADYITVPTESSKDGYYPEFRSKCRVIPQGFNLNELAFERYEPHDIPTFAYAGSLALHFRNPLPLFDFLETLDIDFRFIIYSQATFLPSHAKRLNGKIEIRPLISRSELLKVLSGMDFLVNFENGTAVQTPSKLIDYAITGRPVLSIDTPLDERSVVEFLHADYSRRMQLPDIAQYDIKKVTSDFLACLS
jgi:glycosyltransferase involved in cell wall biosynthesis